MPSVFDSLISQLSRKDYDRLIAEAHKLRPGTEGRIPYRYRVIALGFALGYDLEQVNQRLQQGGEDKLYARNYIEATLIYAFAHRLSYDRWTEIYEASRALFEETAQDGPAPRFSLAGLRAYAAAGMEQLADDRMTRTTRLLQHTAILSGAHTGKLTMRMAQTLTCLQDDQLLAAFMQENILNFSGSRERARYYFVKYLCDYLTCQTELAAKAKAEHRDLSDILPLFKGTNRLPAMSPEALVGTLTEAPVSCAALFDRFNMFYFGYVSVDWLEMVMDELDGDLSQLDPAEKAHLASCLRSYYPKWKQMTDDQIIQAKLETDEAEEERLDAMTAKEFYQTGRSGENSIRSYLQGTLDLDRTSLLFYLLFFGRSLPSTHPDRLSRSRLDEILSNCGFSPLDEKGQDGLDSFVIGFLTSREPSLYLAQTISDYAARRENFHLFKLYSRSVSHQARLEKVFGDGEKA